MSLRWREWIKLKLKKKEALGLSKEESETVLTNIPYFCRISDEMMREAAGEDANINKEFDELPEEQKTGFSRDVIREGLARLKKKKKKVEEESETEKSMIQREAESRAEEKHVTQGS